MKHVTPLLASLFAGLVISACQGSGSVHEAPPTYPAREQAPDSSLGAPGEATPPPPGADYAAPPAALGAAEESKAARSAPAPYAPRKASPRDSAGSSGPAFDRYRSAPEPEARPGLATHWGEQRYSPTREVSFERADDDTPDVLASLHYDDRAGAFTALPNGSWSQSEVALLGGAVNARVVDGYGGVLPAVRWSERVNVIGAPGERYALELQNRTGTRFEVVASVDGLDVLDGNDADVEKRGYLLGAYQTLTIDGFRDAENTVAAFRFGDVGHSYATSQGKARNVGVIGLALFREEGPRVAWPYNDDRELRRSADPFPGRYATPPSAWR
jgi:hypothetical protein